MAQLNDNTIAGLEGIYDVYRRHFEHRTTHEKYANMGLVALLWEDVKDKLPSFRRAPEVPAEEPIEPLNEWYLDVVETSDPNVAYVIQYDGIERDFTKANLIRIANGVPQHIGGIVLSGSFSGEQVEDLVNQLRQDYATLDGKAPSEITLDKARRQVTANVYPTTELGDAFERTFQEREAIPALRSYGTQSSAFLGQEMMEANGIPAGYFPNIPNVR